MFLFKREIIRKEECCLKAKKNNVECWRGGVTKQGGLRMYTVQLRGAGAVCKSIVILGALGHFEAFC